MQDLATDPFIEFLSAFDNLNAINVLEPIFHCLFGSSVDLIAVINTESAITYINPAFLHAINLPIQNVSGAQASSLFEHQSDLKKYTIALEKVLATGKPASVSIEDDSNQNHSLNIDTIRISPIINKEGQLLGVFSIGFSNPVLQVIEVNTIKQQFSYQSALLDNFPFMVWLKDNDGRYLAANNLIAKVANLDSSNALIGCTDFDLFSENIARAFVEDDQDVLLSGIAKTFVEFYQFEAGVTIWLETCKSPIFSQGKVIGTVGYARDISERVRLHKETIKKEQQFKALMQSLPHSIVRYDRQCRRIFMNNHCAYSDNAAHSAAMGKTPSEEWHPNIIDMTGQKFHQILQEVMHYDLAKTFEMKSLHDQTLMLLLINILPEKNEKGEVTGALTIASDITENSQNRQRMERLAFHDALTDLPNRALLNERILLAIKHAKRYKTKLGVLFLDLDNFKFINDTLGHAAGDELLIEVSKRLSDCVRACDVIARMGGDEFAFLITDIKQIEVLAILAQHIVDQFKSPFKVAERDYFVTVSVGVSSYPEDGFIADDLLKFADSAMYVAKRNGGNHYQLYSKEFTLLATAQLKLENLLRQALTQDEFRLLYQPIVSLKTKAIVGAEALIRWHNPELGLLMPDKFICIAEEKGLIVEIGRWAMMSAFKTAVKWNNLVLNKPRHTHVKANNLLAWEEFKLSELRLSELDSNELGVNERQLSEWMSIDEHKLDFSNAAPLCISINVSSRQLIQPDFGGIVYALLQETQCDPSWVKFEITESLLLQESQTLKDTLYFLKAIGIQISIDDFGTGYSALSYLTKFSVSEIKIDRSFIKDITHDENHALLVKSIIALGLSLNKTLIAEGVETIEQAALIYEYGCTLAQGLLFSPPITEIDFERLIHHSETEDEIYHQVHITC